MWDCWFAKCGKIHDFQRTDLSQGGSGELSFLYDRSEHGIVKVPDPRLAAIAQYIPPDKLVPASMAFVDIAGLVKGASKGEGLGNQFLGHIRETNAIAHVVRCFSDPNVVHVDGSVDPQRDISVIDTELILADLDTVLKRYSTFEKTARSGTDKKAVAVMAVLEPH